MNGKAGRESSSWNYKEGILSSHVFEKYWDYLPCLDQYPDFASESQYTQYHMKVFYQVISVMDHPAEAKKTDIEISEHAAISRLRPIQDGLYYWQQLQVASSPARLGQYPDLAVRCSTSNTLIGTNDLW
jgi:lipopolysaccharide biosynthesis protein